MNNIVILKMLDGSELIATKNITGSYSKVRVFHFGANGQAGLAPWVLLAPDADLDISSNGIVAEIPAPQDIETKYLQATSSIQLLG